MLSTHALDRFLLQLSRPAVLALAACGVGIVGAVDYLTGNEVSFSLFYLLPVALASWYGRARAGTGFAVLSCVVWYIADAASGASYSHPTIAIWNTLVRFGFFIITSLLLSKLRLNLLEQRRLAQIDGLTGLYSRSAFDSRLQHDLALARRRRSAITVAYIDLDDFKEINDTQGHPEGDRLLGAVGQVLRHSAREADTAARMGGDEFALILPDTDTAGAQEFMSKLTRALGAAMDGHGWNVTASVGVLTLSGPPTSAARVIAAADALMYRVKRDGKGAVTFGVLDPEGELLAAADPPRAMQR